MRGGPEHLVEDGGRAASAERAVLLCDEMSGERQPSGKSGADGAMVM